MTRGEEGEVVAEVDIVVTVRVHAYGYDDDTVYSFTVGEFIESEEFYATIGEAVADAREQLGG